LEEVVVDDDEVEPAALLPQPARESTTAVAPAMVMRRFIERISCNRECG
jgi:hypothetical protein